MFTACLGLTVAELAAPHDSQSGVVSKVTRIAAQSRDAYVAREILSSPRRQAGHSPRHRAVLDASSQSRAEARRQERICQAARRRAS
jgi:hypothetical protein